MNTNLADFTSRFTSPTLQAKITDMANNTDVLALVAYRDEGGVLKVSAFTELWEEPDPEWVAIYCKHPLQSTTMEKSKTQQALELIEQGMSQYAVAKQLGITQSGISRARNRRLDKTICPCCAQVIRDGFEINKAVLKTSE